MTKKALNVEVDEELWLKLEKVRAEGITKASVVEIALEDFFARENYTDYLDNILGLGSTKKNKDRSYLKSAQ